MAIEVNNISFAYFKESKDLFDSFSASFDRTKITVLGGQSGCGKSTLLYLCAGIYPENGGILRSGSVKVEDAAVTGMPALKRSRFVGMMFQNPELQFCMDTVRNELIFCLENVQTDPALFEEKMKEALAFCGIPELMDRTLISLSGGEKQKVMLACLVMLDPAWLLLDEPFANVDDASAVAIARKLKQLHDEKGTGILAVDHRMDYWLSIADTFCVLEDGALNQLDTKNGALLNEIPSGAGIPSGTEVPGEPADCRGTAAFAEVLEEHGIIVPGRPYPSAIPPMKAGEEVLTLKELSVAFGEKKILDHVSVGFRRGVIYALIGESGAGKSTLFHALSGVEKYKGEALFHGRDLKKIQRSDYGKIGFVTQSPQDQFIGGTVRDEIRISLKQARTADIEKASEEILREIRLWRYRDISPYLLSQGQQRRLGVAALLAYDCEVLVCDEPTYAQDRRNTITIMENLCRKVRERNAAMIFSTHDEQLAKDYADEVLYLAGGKLTGGAR